MTKTEFHDGEAVHPIVSDDDDTVTVGWPEDGKVDPARIRKMD